MIPFRSLGGNHDIIAELLVTSKCFNIRGGEGAKNIKFCLKLSSTKNVQFV